MRNHKKTKRKLKENKKREKSVFNVLTKKEEKKEIPKNGEWQLKGEEKRQKKRKRNKEEKRKKFRFKLKKKRKKEKDIKEKRRTKKESN